MYVEQLYSELLSHFQPDLRGSELRASGRCCLFNWNTHGGLLGQGAPWEAPAMYSLVEAVEQLRGKATGRQVEGTVLHLTSLTHLSHFCFAGSERQGRSDLRQRRRALCLCRVHTESLRA